MLSFIRSWRSIKRFLASLFPSNFYWTWAQREGPDKKQEFLMSGTGVTLAAVVAEGVGFWRQRNMKTFTLPLAHTHSHAHTDRQQHTLLQQIHIWMDNRELCLIFQLFSYSVFFSVIFLLSPCFLPLRQLADNLFKAPDDSVNFLINIKYETLPQPKKSNLVSPLTPAPIWPRNQNWGQMPPLRSWQKWNQPKLVKTFN